MSYITITFKNSLQIEGPLSSIQDNEIVIQSSENNLIIIPNIKDNILYYKINSAEEKFNEVSKKPIKSQSDLEELVRSKGDLNDIERSSIKEKMQAPIKPILKDNYVQQHQSLQGSFKHSEEKAIRKNPSFTEGLQSLFSKTNKKY